MAFKDWILSQVNRSHMHPSEIRFWPDLELRSQRPQREQAERRLNLLLQSSRPEQPFCASLRTKSLLTPALVCVGCWMEGPMCRQRQSRLHLPGSQVQPCTSLPALARVGLGLVSSQRHHCAPSVLQKCQYRGLTFINWEEE